jgi:flagellar motility protein MotE (MotC chaperone)
MKKVRWNHSETETVARRAVMLVETNVYSELQAIRAAQIELLPKQRHRVFKSLHNAANILTEMQYQRQLMDMPTRNANFAPISSKKVDEMQNWNEVIGSIAKLLTQQFKDKLYDALIVELAREAKKA